MTLYIDPGTGSMLFTILLGVVTTLFFVFRNVWMKLKMIVRRGHVEKYTAKRMQYVIFSDAKRYWNVFKPVCDEFEARKTPLTYWTTDADDPALQSTYEYITTECIGEINRAAARLNVMEANVCLSTTPGLGVYQWKRSKRTDWYAHIFHAVGDVSGYRMFGLDHYDAILLSGAYQLDHLRRLEELRNEKPKETEVVGLTYMDALLERKSQSAADEQNRERVNVLVAPSWGESSILCKYGEKILDALLRTGFHIIVRPHPQSLTADKEILERLQEKYRTTAELEWNYDNDNFDVLNRSDVMISDFSGVIFDFVFIFDKPVIYANASFDDAPYDSAWLDEPRWEFTKLDQIGIPLSEEQFSGMKEAIDRAIADQNLAEGREKIRIEAWQYVGESAKRIADYMIAKAQQKTETVQ